MNYSSVCRQEREDMSMEKKQVCPECGKEILFRSKYCGYCGKELKQLEPALSENNKTQHNRYNWGVSGGLAVVLILAIVIVSHLPKKKTAYERLTEAQQGVIENIMSQEIVWKEEGCTNVFFTDHFDQPVFVAVLSFLIVSDGPDTETYILNYYSYSGEMEKIDYEKRSQPEGLLTEETSFYRGFNSLGSEAETREYLAEQYLSYLG